MLNKSRTAAKLYLLAVLVAVAVAVACPSDPAKYNLWHDLTNKSRIDIVMLGEQNRPLALYWQEEVGRHYRDAVVVIGHGGPLFDWNKGTLTWHLHDEYARRMVPAEEVIDRVRERHPYRLIVLISCNPVGQRLNRSRVLYPVQNVWIVPDTQLFTPLGDVYRDPNATGSLADFVRN